MCLKAILVLLACSGLNVPSIALAISAVVAFILPCLNFSKSISFCSGLFNTYFRMADDALPKVSDTTVESMMLDTVNEFWIRFFSPDLA
jgi:hypothetical protein